MIFFFGLGSTRLLNKSKIKAQAWFVYKQINMNEIIRVMFSM